jgi:hypothetical protein
MPITLAKYNRAAGHIADYNEAMLSVENGIITMTRRRFK